MGGVERHYLMSLATLDRKELPILLEVVSSTRLSRGSKVLGEIQKE